MPVPQKNIITIILAAGASRRLGRPKQLEKIDGVGLLERTIRVAHLAGMENILVVTGAQREAIQDVILNLPISVKEVYNQSWQTGMSSSIRAGIQYGQSYYPDTTGALILVCDQAALAPDIIHKVIQAFDPNDQPIVRCSYRAGNGPPVCFSSLLFSELLQIGGDEGARTVIKKHIKSCKEIDFPKGDWDIDEESDLVTG